MFANSSEPRAPPERLDPVGHQCLDERERRAHEQHRQPHQTDRDGDVDDGDLRPLPPPVAETEAAVVAVAEEVLIESRVEPDRGQHDHQTHERDQRRDADHRLQAEEPAPRIATRAHQAGRRGGSEAEEQQVQREHVGEAVRVRPHDGVDQPEEHLLEAERHGAGEPVHHEPRPDALARRPRRRRNRRSLAPLRRPRSATTARPGARAPRRRG